MDSTAELDLMRLIDVSVAAGQTRVCGMADSGHVKLGSALLHASIGGRSASDIQLVCGIRCPVEKWLCLRELFVATAATTAICT